MYPVHLQNHVLRLLCMAVRSSLFMGGLLQKLSQFEIFSIFLRMYKYTIFLNLWSFHHLPDTKQLSRTSQNFQRSTLKQWIWSPAHVPNKKKPRYGAKETNRIPFQVKEVIINHHFPGKRQQIRRKIQPIPSCPLLDISHVADGISKLLKSEANVLSIRGKTSNLRTWYYFFGEQKFRWLVTVVSLPGYVLRLTGGLQSHLEIIHQRGFLRWQ